MFKVINLKSLIVFLGIFIVATILSIGIVSVSKKEVVPKPIYTIVVDAGHGGLDVK